MHCLFFDAPKNNKGYIHYKPLKMCGALTFRLQADLTLKMEIGMPVLSGTEVEFGHFPNLLGNKWTSGMENRNL